VENRHQATEFNDGANRRVELDRAPRLQVPQHRRPVLSDLGCSLHVLVERDAEARAEFFAMACASNISFETGARPNSLRRISKSVVWVSAQTGLKLRFLHSLSQISFRMFSSTGAFRPAFPGQRKPGPDEPTTGAGADHTETRALLKETAASHAIATTGNRGIPALIVRRTNRQ